MKRLFLGMMLCVCTLSLWAVPAKRITMTVEQPDGTVLTLTQNGDEFFHYLTTEDGQMVKSNGKGYYYADIVDGHIVPSKHLAHPLALRSEKEQRLVEELPSIRQFCELALQREETAQRVRASRAAQKVAEVPSTGEVKIPVLLVQYTDVKFSTDDPLATFEGHINGENYKDEGGYGSVKEYFEDQSGGKFAPTFDIIGPITLSYGMKHYGENDEYDNDKDARGMIEEACRKADADFSQYDNDGDGYVDIVYVIYAGYGEASYPDKLANTIWPHQWSLGEPLAMDGVKISKYACNNELDGYQGSTIDGIGTFCHEFSHCLGLPDFYPTGEDRSPFGMESWSLMHFGCYNNNGHTPCGYTGYELDFLGWRELIVIDEPQDVTLTALSEGGSAYKIVNDANPNEYYVVENHKRSNWDTSAPAEGMLVIHVDYSENAWYTNTLNNNPEHQRMTVIPADNKLTKDTQSGDTYPGTTNNTELTASSKPAATVFAGEYMGKDITDISIKDGVVTFSFMKGALGIPKVKGPFDVTENGFSVSWGHVPGVKEYEVSLATLEESPYMLEEDFNKVPGGNTDISDFLDSYTIQKGWQAANVFGIEGAIRVGSTSERGALVTPYIRTDSTCFTILYTIRKSSSSDKDAGMVLCVTDDEWVDEDGYNDLYGYGLTIKNDEWLTYFLVMDSIGDNSYLYIDTRDLGQTSGGNSVRVDIDALYVLEGDLTEELTGSKAPAKVASARRQPAPIRVAEEVDVNAIIARNNTRATRAGEENNSEKRYKTTIVYTEKTSELSYQFKDLDGGLYRCMVRSVRDEVYSRYSEGVDVLLVDSMLPQTAAAFDIYIDKDSVYMTSDNENAELYYTIDGTMPTSYSTHYKGPFALLDKATIYAIAREPNHRRSDVVGIRNWFKTENATFRISSDIDPQVSLSEGMGGNSNKDYAGHYVVPTEVVYDSVSYEVVGIDAAAFSNATSLRSIEIANKSVNHIGDKLFHGCTALNAVVWDVELPIHDTMFDEESYHNLLIYTTDDVKLNHVLINEERMTQVRNGVSDKLTLDGDHSFYCPREFTVESVSYQRSFAQNTGKGDAAGWETIVLPFDVQKFSHASKGEVAPFGIEAKNNFWLAELTNEGFNSTTEIRANVPYIIAMPNNTEYGDNSISGTITFSAAQATIQPTDKLTSTESAEFTFVPTYESVTPSADIYVLNVGSKYEDDKIAYKAGSVFVPNKYTAAPFSAYVVPATAHKSAPFFRIQKEADIEDTAYTFSVKSLNGVVYVTLPEAKAITIYDMTGRKVCSVACEMGVNEITNLSEGIYLIENVKIVVKH